MTFVPKKTALITGASSGIGAAFARRLTADGYHPILVARRLDRLETLAEELRRRHGVEAEPLAADLARPEDLDRLERRIAQGPPSDLLINNAGFGAGGWYHEIDMAKQLDMIQVHVVATARLTRAALPGMVARGDGGVINVASVAGFGRMPKSAMYCSTKAWMVRFSEILAREMRPHAVRVQALCPGFTYSEFHDSPEYKGKGFERSQIPRGMWMTSEAVVAASLRALARGRTICVPGWKNFLLSALLRSPIEPLFSRSVARRQKH